MAKVGFGIADDLISYLSQVTSRLSKIISSYSAFKNPLNIHRRTTKNKFPFKKSTGAPPVVLRRAIASIEKKGWWRVSDGNGRASATYNWMERGCGPDILQTNFGQLASISLFCFHEWWTIVMRFYTTALLVTFWTDGLFESTDTVMPDVYSKFRVRFL